MTLAFWSCSLPRKGLDCNAQLSQLYNVNVSNFLNSFLDFSLFFRFYYFHFLTSTDGFNLIWLDWHSSGLRRRTEVPSFPLHCIGIALSPAVCWWISTLLSTKSPGLPGGHPTTSRGRLRLSPPERGLWRPAGPDWALWLVPRDPTHCQQPIRERQAGELKISQVRRIGTLINIKLLIKHLTSS